MKQLFFLLILVGLLSCNTSARIRNVWFGDAVLYSRPSNNITRVFIDRYGSIYPALPSIYIHYEAFNHVKPKADEPKIFDKGLRDNTLNPRYNLATLHYYFNYRANHDQWNNWRASVNWDDYSARGYLDSFFRLQTLLANNVSKSIIENYRNDKTTLVILIHGFNDHAPIYDYQLAEEDIKNVFGDASKVQFLEVYWDGLTANNGNPAFAKIWGKAQYNSRYVGLRLRQILAKCDKDLKIRVLTHSLGASVANFIFFNPGSMSEPKDNLYRQYFRQTAQGHIPQTDTRVAYLAPAIPGMSTFGTFKSDEDGIYPLQKIIVGHNRNDYALRKNKILKATSLGSTSLGSNYDDEVENTRKKLADSGFSNFVDYDFKRFNDTRKTLEQHSFKYYRMRNNYIVFLNELMN